MTDARRGSAWAVQPAGRRPPQRRSLGLGAALAASTRRWRLAACGGDLGLECGRSLDADARCAAEPLSPSRTALAWRLFKASSAMPGSLSSRLIVFPPSSDGTGAGFVAAALLGPGLVETPNSSAPPQVQGGRTRVGARLGVSRPLQILGRALAVVAAGQLYCTRSPSRSSPSPARSTAEMCTNASGPPNQGDEAEALRSVEPLDRTSCITSLIAIAHRARHRGVRVSPPSLKVGRNDRPPGSDKNTLH